MSEEKRPTKPAVDLIGKAIADMFTLYKHHTREDVMENIRWLMENIEVEMWCDCSYNFTKEKLIKYYYLFLKEQGFYGVKELSTTSSE